MSQNMRRLPPGSLHLAGLLSPSFIRVATPAGCPFSRRGRVTVHVASFPRLPGTWAVSWSRPREDSCSPPCSRNAPHAPPRALTARQRHLRLSCPQESDSGLAVPSPPLLRPLHPPTPGRSPRRLCRGPTLAGDSSTCLRLLCPNILDLFPLRPSSHLDCHGPSNLDSCFLPCGPSVPRARSGHSGGLASSWDLLPVLLSIPPNCQGPQELPFCSLMGQGWAAAPFFPGV